MLKNTGLALGLGMTSGLAGCLGSDGSNTQFSPNADELTVWHAMGGTNGETLDQIGQISRPKLARQSTWSSKTPTRMS